MFRFCNSAQIYNEEEMIFIFILIYIFIYILILITYK